MFNSIKSKNGKWVLNLYCSDFPLKENTLRGGVEESKVIPYLESTENYYWVIL